MRTPIRSRRKASRKVGRPPGGDGGERVKDYPQVSFRLPEPIRNKILVLSKVRQQPQWRLIVEAVEAYFRGLPSQERTRIAKLLSSTRPSKNVQ
jgi:hypothetical protein